MLRMTVLRTAAAAVCLLMVGGAHAAVTGFGALLSGAQEVPAVTTPGSGQALVLYDDSTMEFVWNLSFEDLLAPVGVNSPTAHVHNAPAGVNGPVEFFIDSSNAGTTVDGTGKTEGIFAGVQILDAAQETALFAGNLYFNLHTEFSPGGEIRGQILPAEIKVVPVPPALVLLGSALGVVAYARRRRPQQGS